MKTKLVILAIVIIVLGGGWYFYKNSITDWKTYTDEEYGFEVTFPESWKNVSVAKTENAFAFSLPTSDENWPNVDVSLLVIEFLPIDKWRTYIPEKDQDMLPHNEKYGIDFSWWQDIPDDLISAAKDASKVIDSFKFKK